jgi:hypothetical protein
MGCWGNRKQRSVPWIQLLLLKIVPRRFGKTNWIIYPTTQLFLLNTPEVTKLWRPYLFQPFFDNLQVCYGRWRQQVTSLITTAQMNRRFRSFLLEMNNKLNNSIRRHCCDVIRDHSCEVTMTSFLIVITMYHQTTSITIVTMNSCNHLDPHWYVTISSSNDLGS